MFACLPAGLLSASSSWGLGIKAEHLVSSDDFQGGGGRSSPEMSDTSGVSHNSDSGGGSGTWKGEPDVEGEKKAIPVSQLQPQLSNPDVASPLTRQQLCIMCEVGSQAWQGPGRVAGSLQFTWRQYRSKEATRRLGG